MSEITRPRDFVFMLLLFWLNTVAQRCYLIPSTSSAPESDVWGEGGEGSKTGHVHPAVYQYHGR